MKLLQGRVGLAVRIAITALAVGALVAWIDWHTVGKALRGADLRWVALGFACLVGNSVQQAMRWRGMLGRRDIPPVKFVHFVFVGHFVTLFVPSQVGSDALKAVAFGRKHGDVGLNVGVQIAMRLAGLIALGLFSLTGFAFYFPRLRASLAGFRLDLPSWTWIAALAVVPPLGACIWLVGRFRHASWLAPLREMAVNPRYLGESLAWSLAIQFISSLALYAQFHALMPSPDLGMILFFTSIAQVLLLLPLSVGGVGVREWVLITLFHSIGGMPRDTILAVTLLGYANLMGLAGIGGAWIAFRSFRSRR